MPVGDMFIVLGHETKTRYDAKAQAVTTRTEYFVPCAKNTREEAADFVEGVKGCYHADIVQLWNPRHERTCRDDGNGCCSNCGSPAPQMFARAFAESPKYCPECGAKVVE